MGSSKKFTRTPWLTRRARAGSASSSSGGNVVFYDDVIVGEYIADLLVEDQVIVEIKVVGALNDVHLPQCRSCLSATGKLQCMLINFGRPKVEIRRVAAEA